MRSGALFLQVLALAACGDGHAEGNGAPAAAPVILPVPDIPVALRGCWDAPAPGDPEEPGGAFRAVIEARTITVIADGVPTRVATAEYVSRITANGIEGLFSAPEGQGRATVATSLLLGPDDMLGIPAGTLRLAEGDAGSSVLERCRREASKRL